MPLLFEFMLYDSEVLLYSEKILSLSFRNGGQFKHKSEFLSDLHAFTEFVNLINNPFIDHLWLKIRDVPNLQLKIGLR